MSTVEEIEAAIEKLPPTQIARIATWMADRYAVLWDKQIEEDSASGKLDFLFDEAKREIAAGQARPLDELLDHP